MPIPNFFLTSLLVCAALLLTGAVNQQPAPSAQFGQLTGSAGEPPAAGPRQAGSSRQEFAEAAATLLDRAIAAVAPERLRWLETTLSQRVDLEDVHYQVQGRYLAAPGQRVRLTMEVRVGETRGKWEIISDGRTLTELYQVGAGASSVSQTPLPAGRAGQDAATVEASREQFLEAQGIAGVRPLLRLIRGRVLEARTESVRWGGRDVLRISGRWPADAAGIAGLPEHLQSGGVPRHCRVFLDAQTLWPYRVEWWGAAADGKPGTLLSQTEFRQAVLNRELSPERSAREFTFVPPG